MTVAALARTLDQELQALLRGASLECLVCGEFVQHVSGAIRCPECGADYGRVDETPIQLSMQAG
jgi:Zn finger protein HypA/HybF involved in hydrogenase expression